MNSEKLFTFLSNFAVLSTFLAFFCKRLVVLGLAVKDFELFYKDALVAEKFGHDSSFTHLKLMSIQLSTVSGLTDQTELHARVTVQHLIRQGVKLKTTSKQN